MDISHHYQKLFEYDAWANRAVAEGLRMVTNPPAQAVKRLSHIIGSEKMWLARLTMQPKEAVWPGLSLDDCERELARLPERWRIYLKGLAPQDFEAKIPYVNTQGESWTNTVEDILLQVMLHSSYHRGQMAVDLRAAGLEPAYTDYIHAVRQSLMAE